jgi:hypothetical protein
MPMRLDEGWNQIQFNLSDFTRRAYGTNYIETLRVQIHANCRIRRIYFSDRLYSEEELPPEFKLFLPISKAQESSMKNPNAPLISNVTSSSKNNLSSEAGPEKPTKSANLAKEDNAQDSHDENQHGSANSKDNAHQPI